MDVQANRRLRGIDRTLRVSASAAGLLFAVWLLRDILLLVFAAVLIACVLRGASNWLHRKTGIGPGWSLLAVVVALLVVAGGIGWWRGPFIADQAGQVLDQFVSQSQRLWQNLDSTKLGQRVVERLRGEGRSLFETFGGFVPSLAGSVLGLGGSLVVVVATALFLAAAPGTYVEGLLSLLTPSWRARGREVLHGLGETLQLWFVGQLLDMAAVTLLAGTGLFALGVPLAPTLAVFAGLLNFVPYVGALAGAVPAVLVGLSQSPTQALWVALLFLVVQTLEGNVIAPLIQKRTISMPPVLTILSQTVLGTLFGGLGLILATPVAAASMVAVQMIYIETVLEKAGEDSA